MTPTKEQVLEALASGKDTVPLMAALNHWNAMRTRKVIEQLIGTSHVLRTGRRHNPRGGTPHAVYALGNNVPLTYVRPTPTVANDLYGFVHRYARLPNKVGKTLYLDSERGREPYGVCSDEYHGECIGRARAIGFGPAYIGHPMVCHKHLGESNGN